ncbi:hypothetical protein D3C76_1553220 [compost metagenome]
MVYPFGQLKCGHTVPEYAGIPSNFTCAGHKPLHQTNAALANLGSNDGRTDRQMTFILNFA